jgi:Na+-transporting methylmalonyl-CoA/oxaloacetate decarboxylase gamma subunit
VGSIFAQPLWITLFGMAITFVALALVMGAMVVLTRLVREVRPPAASTEPGYEPEEPPGAGHERPEGPERQGAAGAGGPDRRAPSKAVAGEEVAIDLALPAGVEMAEALAAVVAVATARELARQRHSARVWLSPQPRSLISPWQLVARGWQMDRSRR